MDVFSNGVAVLQKVPQIQLENLSPLEVPLDNRRDE
jgi:hypothetical protein